MRQPQPSTDSTSMSIRLAPPPPACPHLRRPFAQVSRLVAGQAATQDAHRPRQREAKQAAARPEVAHPPPGASRPCRPQPRSPARARLSLRHRLPVHHRRRHLLSRACVPGLRSTTSKFACRWRQCVPQNRLSRACWRWSWRQGGCWSSSARQSTRSTTACRYVCAGRRPCTRSRAPLPAPLTCDAALAPSRTGRESAHHAGQRSHHGQGPEGDGVGPQDGHQQGAPVGCARACDPGRQCCAVRVTLPSCQDLTPSRSRYRTTASSFRSSPASPTTSCTWSPSLAPTA